MVFRPFYKKRGRKGQIVFVGEGLGVGLRPPELSTPAFCVPAGFDPFHSRYPLPKPLPSGEGLDVGLRPPELFMPAFCVPNPHPSGEGLIVGLRPPELCLLR